LAIKNLTAINQYRGSFTTVLGMEMGRSVIVVIKSDNDPIESTNYRRDDHHHFENKTTNDTNSRLIIVVKQ